MRHEDILDQARIGGYAVVNGEKLPISMLDGVGRDSTMSIKTGWLHDDDITAILPPDDPDVERITDITQVRVGDIEMITDGNRYEVVEVDANDFIQTLRVRVFGADCWVDNHFFAYAERPKFHLPEIPDHVMGPLHFRDAEGREIVYWKVDEYDCFPWLSSKPQSECADCWGAGGIPDYIALPLTPCQLEDDHG